MRPPAGRAHPAGLAPGGGLGWKRSLLPLGANAKPPCPIRNFTPRVAFPGTCRSSVSRRVKRSLGLSASNSKGLQADSIGRLSCLWLTEKASEFLCLRCRFLTRNLRERFAGPDPPASAPAALRGPGCVWRAFAHFEHKSGAPGGPARAGRRAIISQKGAKNIVLEYWIFAGQVCGFLP